MKTLIKHLLLLLIALSFSGCGTMIKLGANEKDKRFLATRADACLLKEFWATPCQTSAGYFKEMKIMTPVVLVDIPVAVVFDTLLFPLDSYNYYNQKENQSKEKAEGSGLQN